MGLLQPALPHLLMSQGEVVGPVLEVGLRAGARNGDAEDALAASIVEAAPLSEMPPGVETDELRDDREDRGPMALGQEVAVASHDRGVYVAFEFPPEPAPAEAVLGDEMG